MKDKIMYEVQYSDETFDWDTVDVFYRIKEAKGAILDFMKEDEELGLTYKYRIVKLTIKKEIVK
jgi:hypothetical protein